MLTMHWVNGLNHLPMTSTLETIHVDYWKEPRLMSSPHGRCNSLRELHLRELSITSLPDNWLANCSSLEVLTIESARNLIKLPINMLNGTPALKHLVIRETGLETLPEGLFNFSPRLKILALDNNKLQTISRSTFAVAKQLQEVRLFVNNLDSRVMNALKPLVSLRNLDLRANRELGDVCGPDGYSAICHSSHLQNLDLSWTGVNRICHDWRELKFLQTLELSYTNVTTLTFDDLVFTSTEKLDIYLSTAPITSLETSRMNYKNAANALSNNTTVWLNPVSQLNCDCRMFWTRLALNLSLSVLKDFGDISCSNGQPFREVRAEDMECAGSEECSRAALPVGCKCSVRPDDDTEHDTLLVRADCQRLGLTRIPRLRAPSEADLSEPTDTQRVYELQLSHNNISVIHADDVQDNIKGLDLRHNQVSAVSPAAAARLGEVRGVLQLAGNPLECSCRAAPLLRALTARPAALTDRSEATCSDGSMLHSAPLEQCHALVSPTGWLAIALGLALALVLVAAVSLGSHERRFFIRVLLHRWGFEWRVAEPKEDAARRYDAFVTFSHKDLAVVRELIDRLEPRYRLCVHTRDWIPGRLIAEQVSESVSDSRRTLALVSRHFLASGWACAEFHEAHAQAMLDAQPRLLVILLEEPSELHMIRQLKRYVSSRTYLLRSDPWFWDKLEVALPRPRDRRNSSSSICLDEGLELESSP